MLSINADFKCRSNSKQPQDPRATCFGLGIVDTNCGPFLFSIGLRLEVNDLSTSEISQMAKSPKQYSSCLVSSMGLLLLSFLIDSGSSHVPAMNELGESHDLGLFLSLLSGFLLLPSLVWLRVQEEAKELAGSRDSVTFDRNSTSKMC